ncbi:MAG: toll/interleukin-1 receptor domain-containing protein [Leptolyngbya sp. SIO1E4]|nr:toll/interleukin-1 receptor domain-containing protein [Leptolyngbya sp. SIO1E4]
MRDFFISYNRHDADWAEWIAWILEENGYTVTIQAWDFRPGGNFAVDMNEAIKNSKRTIAVLSETYLESDFTLPEWAAAFINDPTSKKRKLLPIRVKPCEPDGLLRGIVYTDLIGKSEEEAETALLRAVSKTRDKPGVKPSFPGKTPLRERLIQTKKAFPTAEIEQDKKTIEDSYADIIMPKRKLSSGERRALKDRLTKLLPEQLTEFIDDYAESSKRYMPSSDSSPSERVSKLLEWADSEAGLGSVSLRDSLDEFIDLIKNPDPR